MSINKKETLDNLFGLNGFINNDLFGDKIDELIKYLKYNNEYISYIECPNYINIIYRSQMLERLSNHSWNDEMKFNLLLYYIYKFYNIHYGEPIEWKSDQEMVYNINGNLFNNSYKIYYISNALKVLTFHFQNEINKELENLPSITTLSNNIKTTFEELPFYIAVHIAKGIINEYVDKLKYVDYETRLKYYETLQSMFNKYYLNENGISIDLFNNLNVKCGLEYYFPVLNIPLAKNIFDKYLNDILKCHNLYGDEFKSMYFMFSISDILKLYQIKLEEKRRQQRINKMICHDFTRNEYCKYKNVFIDCSMKALRRFKNYNLRYKL